MTQPLFKSLWGKKMSMYSSCRLQNRSWFWSNLIIMKFLWDRLFIIVQKGRFNCFELGLCEFVKLILNFPNLACLQSSYGFIRNLKMIKRNCRLNFQQIQANDLLIIQIISWYNGLLPDLCVLSFEHGWDFFHRCEKAHMHHWKTEVPTFGAALQMSQYPPLIRLEDAKYKRIL